MLRLLERGWGKMVLTKALETYGKYFRMIVAIVLPVGIVIGSILCGISNSEYHKQK